MNTIKAILMIVMPAFALVCAACNTDPLWAEHQKVDAPLTDRGSPSGITLPDIQIADAHEVDLVEDVLARRAMYYRTLRALHDYYRDRGNAQKQTWAATELLAVERVQPFKYLLSAEIPAEDLRPVDAIAEADAIYERGLDLMKKGGHGVPALYSEETMLEALAVFVDLISQYPSSDKIDDAAFFCGEIHKEYLKDQEPIAVRWYERAYTWDSETPHPARFQAAVAYDYRMHDRARALELYRLVLDQETFNKSNVSFAVTRIHQLTVEQEGAPPEQTGETSEMFGFPAESPAQGGRTPSPVDE